MAILSGLMQRSLLKLFNYTLIRIDGYASDHFLAIKIVPQLLYLGRRSMKTLRSYFTGSVL